MNESSTERVYFGFCALLMLLAGPRAVQAFSYEPTPLSKAVAAHDLVLVAKVKERAGGMVKIEPLLVVKANAPDEPIALPRP